MTSLRQFKNATSVLSAVIISILFMTRAASKILLSSQSFRIWFSPQCFQESVTWYQNSCTPDDLGSTELQAPMSSRRQDLCLEMFGRGRLGNRKWGSEQVIMKRYLGCDNMLLQLFSSNFPSNMLHFIYS